MAARTPHLDDLEDLDRHDPALRAWLVESIRRLDADAQRSADTHLVRIPLPERWGIDLYLKDESTHLTGSLKHRLARSLFMYALVNGWLAPGMPVVEASSGSTAVSEAHFARVLGLPFIAVMPRSTSVEKIRLIEAQGGTCHFVDTADEMCAASQRLASELGGHFLDQFTYAERATDWRGHNNIAESILRQMADEPHLVPAWLVVAAGTGGTSATLGRYFRYRRLATRLCVADVEKSAFFDGWADHDPGCRVEGSSRIEGIGRPQVEPSFIPAIVDRMIRVPDAASVAASRFLSDIPDEVMDWRRLASSMEGLWDSSSRGSGWGSGSGWGGGGGFRGGSKASSGKVTTTKAADRPKFGSATPRGDVPNLAPGDRVTHDTYGLGTVVALEGSGSSAVARIDFGSAGTKRLLLRYAPVEKL